MKCEFCGGNLDLEMPTCPHCGAVNKHARQHIEDMNRYRGQFENTKKDVYRTAQKYSDVMIRAIIIAVLVIVSVVLLIVRANAYSISNRVRDMKVRAQRSMHVSVLDGYLENEDFIQFAGYCEKYGIRWWSEDFSEYYYVSHLASDYKYFCETLVSIVFLPRYDTEPGRKVEVLCSYLNNFYEEWDRMKAGDSNKYLGITEEDVAKSVKYGEEMRDHMNAMLITYFHLTQEEIEEFPSMSNAQRTVLLEGKINYGE